MKKGRGKKKKEVKITRFIYLVFIREIRVKSSSLHPVFVSLFTHYLSPSLSEVHKVKGSFIKSGYERLKLSI